MRIRVRNPHHHGRLLASIITVLVLGQAAVVAMPSILQQPGAMFSLALVWVAIVLCAAIPTRCQHLSWCVIYGAIIGAAPVVLPVLSDVITGQAYLSFVRPTTLLVFATLSVLGATIGIGALLAWTTFYRHAVRRVEIQDGTLCPTCAYCIKHLPTNTCPECGNEFDVGIVKEPGAPPSTEMRPRRRKSVACIVLLGAVLLVSVGARWLGLTPPLYAIRTSSYWANVLRDASEPREDAFSELSEMLLSEVGRGRTISAAEVRSILGPPDLFIDFFIADESATDYLYFFTDHRHPSAAYLHFVDGQLTGGFHSTSSVNDLSTMWQPYDRGH